MKRIVALIFLLVVFPLTGTNVAVAQDESASYFYDSFFRCGISIPGEWKAVDVNNFHPTIVPTGISPESFEVYWYQEIRLVPGIRMCWVQRLSRNNYATLYLRFAPIYYILEDGETLGAMGLEDVKQALAEWASEEGAMMSGEITEIGGIKGLKCLVTGSGYGFSVKGGGLIPTSASIYACTVYPEGREYLLMIEMCAPSDEFADLVPGFERAVGSLEFGEPKGAVNLVQLDESATIPIPSGPPAQFNFSAPPASMLEQAPFNPYSGTDLTVRWPDGKVIPFADFESRRQITETISRIVGEDEEISEVTVWLQYPSNELTGELSELFSELIDTGVKIQPVFQQGAIRFSGETHVSAYCDWIELVGIPLDFNVISISVDIGELGIEPASGSDILLGEDQEYDASGLGESNPFSGIVLKITWPDDNELVFDIDGEEQLTETILRMLKEDEIISDLTIWFQLHTDRSLVKPYSLWSGFHSQEIEIEPRYLIGYINYGGALSAGEFIAWLDGVGIPDGLEVISTLVEVSHKDDIDYVIYEVPDRTSTEETDDGPSEGLIF